MNIRLKCSATEFNLFIIADSLVIQFGLRKHDSGGYIPTIQGSDDRNKALSLAAWTYGELQDRCLSTGQFKLMWSRQALLTAQHRSLSNVSRDESVPFRENSP